ncbi:Na-translocating system protein MpsC family protein [Paenibacillus puldeungensis]|uniref:Na-translocating system protein MpsC family protein n=1 Tax=Paenibacillus puldeungensis TaxID=696536 RepID=A0ABW3S3U5_9BACL
MSTTTVFEYQEKIRRLAVKIVKHYRGKGPENVKVNLEDEGNITVQIKGFLSNLSEILVKEGAVDLVTQYWEVLQPYLEREFMQEAMDMIGSPFTYAWTIRDDLQGEWTIVIEK